ncbi:hypothetical protein [Thermostichus sp. MS-CIW-15]
MVADENVWLEIQETTEGNLALSMEEEEILQSTSMPLLINGRAGSGKSLMLYYRFADYCSHYLKDSSKGSFQYRPLFLTYSPSLVQQARSKVSTILRVNHRYRERGSDFSEGEIERCQAFFSTFQDYLLSCLPPERQERYQPERYVNFYRFRSWYRGRSDVELAWHTIRTLIKGYGVSDYLDPDCYRELPQADRTVNVEVFDRIYEQVWLGYQERTTYGSYWDDQDLARDVLQNGFLRSIHPVIFCDEVQDFTQLELNIVFCLSPWGKYKLDWAAVQAHPQTWQRGHDYELVASMARDMETNWDELRWKLPGLRDFLQEVVSSVRGEHAWWLQPLEVGLAYERLGCYRDALRFYERFAENRIGRIPRWQCSQIRQRWLLVHKKYRDSLQAEGRPTDLLAEEFSRAQERWREQLPQAEPELEEWDPWPHDFVEHPSPVQSWLLQREQTEAQRLQVAIREELKRLNERQLQQVHSLIQRLLGPG